MATLVSAQRRDHLNSEITSVGASEACEIRDGRLLPTHAYIKLDGSRFWVIQAHPNAKVFVNHRAIRKHPLAHGDLLKIGALEYQVDLLDQAPTEHESVSEDDLQSGFPYERVLRFAELLVEQGHTEELFEVLMDEVIALTRADHGLIMSFNQGERVVRVARGEGEEDPYSQLSDTIAQQVIESRRPLLICDLDHADDFNPSESIIRVGLTSVMCTPLMFKQELLGIIYVGARAHVRTFGEPCLKVLQAFSALAAILLKGTLTRDALQSDNQRLREELEIRRFGSLIGSSSTMANIFERVNRVADTDVSVLIQGETGTGKEMVARELHLRSDRAEGPFVAINCGAIPQGLIESELFGHVKGAFTDAIQAKEGCLLAANGGTLFLDELGEMPLSSQVKLLRVLQEREVQPLGSGARLPLDIRLICATQVRLFEAVERGTFREDLFYRINTVTIDLPPLRERGADVLLITRYLVQRFCERYNLDVKALSPEAVEAVQRYSWPGNIRELENRISQALILSNEDQITPLDLQLTAERLSMELRPLAEAKEEFIQEYVEHALSINQGNRTRAALQLGIDPRTIFRLLKKKSSSNEGA